MKNVAKARLRERSLLFSLFYHQQHFSVVIHVLIAAFSEALQHVQIKISCVVVSNVEHRFEIADCIQDVFTNQITGSSVKKHFEVFVDVIDV